jgi:hypothetical protein
VIFSNALSLSPSLCLSLSASLSPRSPDAKRSSLSAVPVSKEGSKSQFERLPPFPAMFFSEREKKKERESKR